MTKPAGPDRSDTDRIEKQITLRAPVARVWKALTDSKEFGAWFRVNLDGQFKPGGRIRGNITWPGYEHVVMDVTVERMDRERLFSFRWHPAAIDPKRDYGKEPTTLVEFRLETIDAGGRPDGGTRLTVVESGFDALPPDRRQEALRMNSVGWEVQVENIRKHVDG
jgi:uncharacterized protein YndB with AHSA1/START domain